MYNSIHKDVQDVDRKVTELISILNRERTERIQNKVIKIILLYTQKWWQK